MQNLDALGASADHSAKAVTAISKQMLEMREQVQALQITKLNATDAVTMDMVSAQLVKVCICLEVSHYTGTKTAP
jgi:hypothetical protein